MYYPGNPNGRLNRIRYYARQGIHGANAIAAHLRRNPEHMAIAREVVKAVGYIGNLGAKRVYSAIEGARGGRNAKRARTGSYYSGPQPYAVKTVKKAGSRRTNKNKMKVVKVPQSKSTLKNHLTQSQTSVENQQTMYVLPHCAADILYDAVDATSFNAISTTGEINAIDIDLTLTPATYDPLFRFKKIKTQHHFRNNHTGPVHLEIMECEARDYNLSQSNTLANWLLAAQSEQHATILSTDTSQGWYDVDMVASTFFRHNKYVKLHRWVLNPGDECYISFTDKLKYCRQTQLGSGSDFWVMKGQKFGIMKIKGVLAHDDGVLTNVGLSTSSVDFETLRTVIVDSTLIGGSYNRYTKAAAYDSLTNGEQIAMPDQPVLVNPAS